MPKRTKNTDLAKKRHSNHLPKPHGSEMQQNLLSKLGQIGFFTMRNKDFFLIHMKRKRKKLKRLFTELMCLFKKKYEQTKIKEYKLEIDNKRSVLMYKNI